MIMGAYTLLVVEGCIIVDDSFLLGLWATFCQSFAILNIIEINIWFTSYD